MRILLLGLASLTIGLSAPAAAQSAPALQFSSGSGGWSHHGGFGQRDRDRGRYRDNGAFYYDYYREYQGNTTWKSDSFNDWWHDRPDRAYPRWIATNQNCDRKWWSGETLRC